MPKRILITAANGFGPHIIDAFQQKGYEVFALARNNERKQSALAKNLSLKPENVLVCDFNEDMALDSSFWEELLDEYQIDGVVNNAMVTPKNSITKPSHEDQSRTHRVNTAMPIALFEACANKDIPLIQQSTHNAHLPNDEHDIYRQSKNAARKALQEVVKEKGLNAVVIEPGMMSVPGSGHYKLDVIAALPIKMKLMQGAGTMQPIATRDVTEAMVGMMENLWQNNQAIEAGKVYQAAGHIRMNLDEYIGTIQKALGIEGRKQVPMPMPLKAMEPVMDANSNLPFAPFGKFDGFDMQELRRDFSVEDDEVRAFMRAGKLTTLRDPVIDFHAYAESNKPYSRFGALCSHLGIDVERWWQSVKNEEWSGAALPIAGAPSDEDIKQAHDNRATPPRTLVVGATGFMGPLMVQELLAKGHEVVCAVRNIEKAKKQLNYSGIEFIQADLNEDINIDTWKTRLKENRIDTVVSNAGIEADAPGQDMENINVRAPIAIAKACDEISHENSSPIRFLQISSGLITSPEYKSFPYPVSKEKVENALGEMKNLDWLVIRPNYVYEPGRGHVLFEEVVQLPMLFFTKDGAKQPIFNRDLAIGIARLAEHGQVSRSILEAAGEENMRWRDMLERVGEAIREEIQYTPSIHRKLASLAVRINQHIPESLLKRIEPYVKIESSTLSKVDPQTFRMLSTETRSDPADWIQETGCRPASIAEVYRAWKAGPDSYMEFCQEQRDQQYKAKQNKGFVARLLDRRNAAKENASHAIPQT